MEQLLNYLEQLGCPIKNPGFLSSALMHASAKGDKNRVEGSPYFSDCRTLASIGGQILSAIYQKKVLLRNPTISIKELSQRNTNMTYEANLASIAKSEGLDRFIIIGSSLKSANMTSQILADELCAIIGVLFMDTGFATAQKYAEYIIQKYSNSILTVTNYKTELQELVAHYIRGGDNAISYETSSSGAGANMLWKATLFVHGHEICKGTGRNKKQSEIEAARNALTTNREKLIVVLNEIKK